MRGNRDLAVVPAAALLCALIALLAPVEAIQIVAGLPLTLFLPGYAIVAATFARRPLDPARSLLLSFAMSLAVLAIGALVLSLIGIYPGTWALLLALLVAGCCWWAALRRGRPAGEPRHGGEGLRLTRRDLALLAAAAVLGVAAIVLAQAPFAADRAVGYTSLWMLPGRGARSVEIGAASAEQAPAAYVLKVEAGGGQLLATERFRLEPGGEEVFRVPVRLSAGSRPLPVVATLYQAKRPGRVYRRVISWLSRETRT